MCGIEILLCCAAGGAAGCCAKHKMDKNAKKKSAKGVKGDSEVYRKNGEKAKQAKASKKEPKKTVQEPPRHRQSAYEEYKNRYEAKPDTTASLKQGSDLHRRSTGAESPKGGLMDAEEFGRLKAAQQREKLNALRY